MCAAAQAHPVKPLHLFRIAKNKGVFFNELLELDWDHVSPINLNLDLCARVKVTLAES